MAVWIVGGPSRPKARRAKRKRTGPSLSPRKSRWSRGNDAVKWDFIRLTSLFWKLQFCVSSPRRHHTAIGILRQRPRPDPDKRSFVLGFSNVHISDRDPEIIPASCKKEKWCIFHSCNDEKNVVCHCVLFFFFFKKTHKIKLGLNKPTVQWSTHLRAEQKCLGVV